jgi:hypothetical protein
VLDRAQETHITSNERLKETDNVKPLAVNCKRKVKQVQMGFQKSGVRPERLKVMKIVKTVKDFT